MLNPYNVSDERWMSDVTLWIYTSFLITALPTQLYFRHNFSFFVLFLFLSNKYKLRQTDKPIPYHMFIENQFDSNYKQKETI